jgi:thiol-disulfide isomerase/thioredoxin
MKNLVHSLLLFFVAVGLRAAAPLPIEKEVAEATKSSQVTVVHFWATWCSNCRAELVGGALPKWD